MSNIINAVEVFQERMELTAIRRLAQAVRAKSEEPLLQLRESCLEVLHRCASASAEGEPVISYCRSLGGCSLRRGHYASGRVIAACKK